MSTSKPKSTPIATVPSILYHYTTSAGAKGIRQAGVIKMSGTSGFFGPGVYMTAMDPYSYYRNEIVQNNYGSGSRTNYADWVVFIYTDKLVKTKLHRVTTRANQDIYRYEDDVSVSPSDIHDKPQCKKASASSSGNGSNISIITYTGVQPVTNMETVPKTLYHYVCTADAQAIKNNKKILPGRISGQAANGVLLSSMDPGQFYRDDIKLDIFDGQCPINCVDNVVQVASGQLDNSQLHLFTRQGKYDLYYYDTTITIQQPDVMDKPRCMKPPPGSQQQQHPPYQMYGQQPPPLPYMPYYPYNSPPPAPGIQFIGGQPFVPMMPYNYPPPPPPPPPYGQPPPYTNQSPPPPPNMAYPQQNMYNPYNSNNNNQYQPYDSSYYR